jgi:hypothetical protein
LPPSYRDNGPKYAIEVVIIIGEISGMAKKGTEGDTVHLYYANLAVVAERTGNYEDAAKQWHNASGASLKADSILLYKEAAKRCERRSKEQCGASG